MEKEKINNIGYSIVNLENIDWDEFCVLYDYFDIPNEKDIGMIINRYGSLRKILTIKNANISQSFFGVDDIGFDYTVFQRMFLENGVSSNVDLSNFNLNSYLLGLILNPSEFNTLPNLWESYSDHWMELGIIKMKKYINNKIFINLFNNNYTLENNPNHWSKQYSIYDSELFLTQYTLIIDKYITNLSIGNLIYETNLYDLLFEIGGLSFVKNESLYEYEDKIFGLSVNPSTMDTLPNLWESYSDHWMNFDNDKITLPTI